MKQYRDMIQHILDNGKLKEDRTGTGTLSVFGYQTRYNLQEGFPLLPLKKTFTRGIFEELKWFLNGDTNVKTLIDNDVNIWNADAYRVYKNRMDAFKPYKEPILTYEEFVKEIKENELFANTYGNLGPIYGKQWRNWSLPESKTNWTTDSIDQIQWVIDEIKRNPDSRRLIVNAWNVAEIDDMALPPCHVMFQFYVEDGKLSCQLYQRSADAFLGVPFNIASYAFLVHMIAHVCGLEAGEFIHTFGDLHLYTDHIELAKEMLTREDRPLPQLVLKRDVKDINDFNFEDFEIEGYDPHPTMKAQVSVG